MPHSRESIYPSTVVMSKMEKDQSTELINEILAEADPEFIKDLEGIDASVLNGQDIEQAPSAEDEDTQVPVIQDQGWRHRFWASRSRRFRFAVAGSGFAIGVALPLILMTFFGFFASEKEPGFNSIAEFSDSTFTIAAGEEKENLFRMFPVLVYAIEIPEKVYTFIPGDRVRFGRFSFYIELYNRQDLRVYDNRMDHVMEAIVNVIRKTRSDEWMNPRGQEQIREKILFEINNTMHVRAKKVRFKSIHL